MLGKPELCCASSSFPPPTNAPTATVAVGRPAIANPDLVTRWEKRADENEVDQASVYGPDERGYTDYPFLQD